MDTFESDQTIISFTISRPDIASLLSKPILINVIELAPIVITGTHYTPLEKPLEPNTLVIYKYFALKCNPIFYC